MTIHQLIYLLVFALLIPFKSRAIVPLESLVLGDFANKYTDSLDPLSYIFNIGVSPDQSELMSLKKQIGIYRGFYEEGQNLEKFCSKSAPIKYTTQWDKSEIQRSMIATLQYVGLDILSRALPAYAAQLNYSEDQFTKLTENLVTSTCSVNLSIISSKQLKKLLLTRFLNSSQYQLPTTTGNPLFPAALDNIITRDEVLKREFAISLLMFRSFCSWGGDVDDLRLLVPFAKNATIMSFVGRQFAGIDLMWNQEKKEIYQLPSNGTVRVLCDNLLCRRVDSRIFDKLIKTSIGSESLLSDTKRMYCQELRYKEYKYKYQSTQIKQWIDKITPEQEMMMLSHFVALLTGIPDFSLRADRLSDLSEFSRFSVDKAWNKWSEEQLKLTEKELYFEEPLVVEKVNNSLFFNKFTPQFRVVFDVNQGEFDRINQIYGKINISFDLKLSKSFLGWARREWLTLDPRQIKQRTHVLKAFTESVRQFVYIAREKFNIAPWSSGLEAMIVQELLDQLSEYRGDFFNDPKDQSIVKIPIDLNFSPYALKYMRYKRELQKQQSETSK